MNKYSHTLALCCIKSMVHMKCKTHAHAHIRVYYVYASWITRLRLSINSLCTIIAFVKPFWNTLYIVVFGFWNSVIVDNDRRLPTSWIRYRRGVSGSGPAHPGYRISTGITGTPLDGRRELRRGVVVGFHFGATNIWPARRREMFN